MVSVCPELPSRSPTKHGASSADISESLTSKPFSAASASEASSAEPTSVTSQPCAKSRISALVYSRWTVPLVPSTDTRFVFERAQAGLIAGTVPTKGTWYCSRRCDITNVQAVVQATKTTSGQCAALNYAIRGTSPQLRRVL